MLRKFSGRDPSEVKPSSWDQLGSDLQRRAAQGQQADLIGSGQVVI